MPKQVYVYPGNINDADTIEGTRQVLEPAVDKVYVYDSGSSAYVDVNNTANTIPYNVYLFSPTAVISSYGRENILHWSLASAPADTNGKQFIPIVVPATGGNGQYYQRFGILKLDDSQTSGYTLVASSNNSAYTKYPFIPTKTKILWDNANETIILALGDVIGTDSSSSTRTNMSRNVSVLYKYDKSADSISIIRALNNTNLIQKAPISGNYFYYDSGSDTYTIYQMLLGPSGSLEIRKVVATQTDLTETMETVTLAGATVTPKYPDSVSDPYYFFMRIGMLEKRPWVELSNPLETNTNDFTVMLIGSPNLTTESSYATILKELVLYFERGQYSYDSGTSTWTFTVSSEFSADSLTKSFYNYSTNFLGGKTGIVPARHPDKPESNANAYDMVNKVQITSYDTAATITDVHFEVHVAVRGLSPYNSPYHSATYFGTFTSAGVPVIDNWLALGGEERRYHGFQLDAAELPPILLLGNGHSIYAALKPISNTLVTALAPTSGKYLYDISQASAHGNTYLLVNRVYNSRPYPYITEGVPVDGTAEQVVIVTESTHALPGILGQQLHDINTVPAFNYGAGGTITNIYKRDASGLEALSFWIRSGSTMYTIFSIEFERALDPNSILKYVADNTHVDNLFVLRNAKLDTSELLVFSKLGQLFSAEEAQDSADYHTPTVSIGRISLRPGGLATTVAGYKGTHVYYNPATEELVEVDANNSDSLVLSPLLVYNRYITSNDLGRKYPTQYVSSGGALTTLYNNYYLQTFRNTWGADYEDTIEITVGANTYKYVVVGKYSFDGQARVVVVLEDIA